MVEWLAGPNPKGAGRHSDDPLVGSAPGNTTDCSSTRITSNCYPDARRWQAHETLGPPTEVRSMQSEWLGQIVTISVAQNTVLGKNITTVPYATTKRPRRMPSIFFETSRRMARCWFWQCERAVTQKHHLLTPHRSRDFPTATSNTALSTWLFQWA